jgi:LacI family transcriptional regulator
MRTNLRMIAREAGVGLGTVSRALRGLAGVDPETLARVQAVADRLGYVRDPQLASAFSFARRAEKPVYRETLAFLAVEPEARYGRLAWLQGLLAGFAERAAGLGYAVRCIVTPREAKAQRALSRQLHAQGIRGVAVCPVTDWTPFELDLDWKRFAAVELGHSLWHPALTRVERDLADDFARMFTEIRKRGYRRIGLAMNRDDEVRRRWGVLAAYLLFHHRNPDLPALRPLEDVAGYTKRNLLRWVRQEKPEVIVVNGSEPLDWLQEAGWRFPEDIAVCRIDCIPGRPETGLAADYEQMGCAVVNLLSSALERGELGLPERPGVLSIPNRWNEGSTLPEDVR